MIVPDYWAEGRATHRTSHRQLTVRRFGWSDASQEEAQSNADARARAALERLVAGETLARREPKVAYNGAEGVPIREEILERDGDSVITRNAYGARCLNTPNVLFADVDFAKVVPTERNAAVGAILVFGAVVLAWLVDRAIVGIVLGIVAGIVILLLAGVVDRAYVHARGGARAIAMSRLRAFVERHPDWNVRVYRTPAGLRMMATHRTFEPTDPEVAPFFAALSVDPVYARMCSNQRCFRARLTAKPWRIGIGAHLRPRPGVWPIAPSGMAARRAWVEAYERVAADYAACEYVESVGCGFVDPAVQRVRDLHDRRSGATSGLPIA